jgi:hypothetical protein
MNDPMRELLKREIDKLTREASDSDGAIHRYNIEKVSELSELIELRDSLLPKRRNWPVALVFLGSLAVASVLLFVRVRETDIELDAQLSQVSFSLAKPQALTGPMNLSRLGITGLQDVQWPTSSENLPTPGRRPIAIFLSPSASPGQGSGAVTLDPLPLPSGTRLVLGLSDQVNQYQLLVRASGVALQAGICGPLEVGMSGSPVRSLNYSSPKQVTARGGFEEVNLSLTFPSMPQSPISPQLDVRDVSFMRVDQFLDSNQTLVRRVSMILSGMLFLESLNGQEVRLRPGEELQFEHSSGEIRTLELGAHRIDFKLRATVSGMSVGSGEGHRSIMPTYLEWLRARHGLALLWGASLYLFGITASLLRWWGVRL